MGDIEFSIVAACAALAMLGASFSTIDKYTSIKDSAWHISLAGVLGSLTMPVLANWWSQWKAGVFLGISFLIGLAIYGIAVFIRKFTKTIGDTNPEDLLRKRLDKEGKP